MCLYSEAVLASGNEALIPAGTLKSGLSVRISDCRVIAANLGSKEFNAEAHRNEPERFNAFDAAAMSPQGNQVAALETGLLLPRVDVYVVPRRLVLFPGLEESKMISVQVENSGERKSREHDASDFLLSYSSDGQEIAQAGVGGKIFIRSSADLTIKQELQIDASSTNKTIHNFSDLAFSPQGTELVSVTSTTHSWEPNRSYLISLWNLKDPTTKLPLFSFQLPSNSSWPPSRVRFSRNKELFVLTNNFVQVWKVSDHSHQSYEVPSEMNVKLFDLRDENKILLTGTEGVYEWSPQKETKPRLLISTRSEEIESIEASADGNHLLLVAAKSSMIYNLREKRVVFQLADHEQPILPFFSQDLSSPYGHYVLTGSTHDSNISVRVWDLQNGMLDHEFLVPREHKHFGEIIMKDFFESGSRSVDGRYVLVRLAGQSSANTPNFHRAVKIDLETGIANADKNNERILSATISPQLKSVILQTAVKDGHPRQLEITLEGALRPLEPIPATAEKILSVDLLPDSQTIHVAMQLMDGSVHHQTISLNEVQIRR